MTVLSKKDATIFVQIFASIDAHKRQYTVTVAKTVKTMFHLTHTTMKNTIAKDGGCCGGSCPC